MDFSSFGRMPDPAPAGFGEAGGRRGAIVRLHADAEAPGYVDLNRTAGDIYTTRIDGDQFARLRADPAVADVTLSRVERLID